ncbi:MAG: CRISPR-associated helicase Cas3' [Candidatus Methanomethylicaceae archaeon]
MLKEYYYEILNKNNWSSREFIEKVITLLDKEWYSKNVFIIEAPTGYGKSTISQAISLFSYKEELKSIIVFPIRTLLEDQYEKFKTLSINDKILGKRYMHNLDSKYLIKPITLTTIDTLSLTLFGIPPEEINKVIRKWSGTSFGSLGHYMFSQASIILSNIILDEVHLLIDSTKSLNFLIMLILFVLDNNQKLVLMSATIPTTFKEKLFSNIPQDKRDKIMIISFEKSNMNAFYDEKFVEERKRKDYCIFLHKVKGEEKFYKILDWINLEKDKDKVIVVFNTVKDSVYFYKMLDKRIRENILLIHSRFNEKDREEKVKKLNEIKKKNNYIIVSTQAIEAGIDISSNLLITEIAPANSLIQRFGRFLRYENEYNGNIYVWYEIDKNGELENENGKYKVYDWHLTYRTIEGLKELSDSMKISHDSGLLIKSFKINFHIPDEYKKLLDIVYIEKDFSINKKEVEDLISIFLNIERLSERSLEKYLELEGSFVREETSIPVITLNIMNQLGLTQNENYLDYEQLNNITQYIIPISIKLIKRLKVQKGISIKRENGKERISFEEVPDYYIKTPQKLLKFMLRESIIAFIIEAEYDNEIGLVLDE